MRAWARRAEEKSLCETAAQALCLSEQRQHKAPLIWVTALFLWGFKTAGFPDNIKECPPTQTKRASVLFGIGAESINECLLVSEHLRITTFHETTTKSSKTRSVYYAVGPLCFQLSEALRSQNAVSHFHMAAAAYCLMMSQCFILSDLMEA